MSPLAIILWSILGVLVLGALWMVLFFVGMMQKLKKPLPLRGGVPVTKLGSDISYGDSEIQALDIYGKEGEEKGSLEAKPLLLFVPGDGPEWMLKGAREWAFFRAYVELATAKGYRAAIMNHRSTQNYKNTSYLIEDLEAVLAHIDREAEAYGVDRDRIVVWAFSGSTGPILSHLVKKGDERIKAILSFYGVLDLTTFPLARDKEAMASHSLLYTLKERDEVDIPTYLLGVERDRKMLVKGFEDTVKVIEEKGLSVETRFMPNAKHGFELFSPIDEAQAEVDRAFDFVERSLA